MTTDESSHTGAYLVYVALGIHCPLGPGSQVRQPGHRAGPWSTRTEQPFTVVRHLDWNYNLEGHSFRAARQLIVPDIQAPAVIV